MVTKRIVNETTCNCLSNSVLRCNQAWLHLVTKSRNYLSNRVLRCNQDFLYFVTLGYKTRFAVLRAINYLCFAIKLLKQWRDLSSI